MASWDEILRELGNIPSQVDIIRNKYMRELSSYTKRNTIAYYSSFLNKNSAGTDVNDLDMNGFMSSLKGTDCSKGLDLILHTPGGSPTAAESIVSYLRSKFGTDIRVIVPHMAMSAGTMMACAAKEIIMGLHSSLGPIDPQINGIPAYSILKEFNDAKTDLSSNKGNLAYWSLLLQKYPAAFVYKANEAIELSSELVKQWLSSGMFENDNNVDVQKIVDKLNEHELSKEHSRHFDKKNCKEIGLVIRDLESDNELQDKVLSVHHAFMITFSTTSAIKIIQNDIHPWIVTRGEK